VSVVVSGVCMCSCDWGLYLWYGPPVFWLFVWWTFDTFRRWYYVIGCLLYWVLKHCWCVCNCVRVSGVVVCDTVIQYVCERCVSVLWGICMCDMCVVSDISSWEMTVIGCGVCVERLCV